MHPPQSYAAHPSRAGVYFAVAFSAVLLCGCGVAVRTVVHGVESARALTVSGPGRHGVLSAADRKGALAAWKYFESNIKPQTGIASFKNGYPVATLSSAADTIAAIYCARELGLIKEAEAYDRVSSAIGFLNSMELIEGRMPNRTYNTESMRMVNAANAPGLVGWSSVDMGRLLTWLRIVRGRFPLRAEYVDKAVLRWNMCDALDRCGLTYSASPGRETYQLYPEGNAGYQEYAARGFAAWGYPVAESLSFEPSEELDIDGVSVRHDSLDPRTTGQYAPVTTMPHVLAGIEFDWRVPGGDAASGARFRDAAARVFQVQQARFEKENQLTARAEHSLDRAPYFVWDTIFLAGFPWNTITEDGKYAPEESLVSTRAALGLWVLWSGAYTDRLKQTVGGFYDPAHGWFEGLHEQTGGIERSLSSATNAAVLEVLLYYTRGVIFSDSGKEGYFERSVKEKTGGPGTCYAPVRQTCGS